MVKVNETNLTEFLDQFRPLLESDTKEAYQQLTDLCKKQLELPEFASTFKEREPLYTITGFVNSYGAFSCTITDPEGEAVGGTYSNLTTPYDYVERELNGRVKFAGDLSLTGNEPSEFSGEYSFVSENNRLLLEGDIDDEALAKYDYLMFLFLVENYLKDPLDFYYAYRFFTRHPAFWSRYTATSDDWKKEYDSYWFDITTNKEKELVYMFEAGSAIGEERTSHYHDLRLDVYGKSFEDGIIQIAAKTHKFFDFYGEERKNVDYTKSQLELDLEAATERVADMIEQQEEQGLE